MKAQDSIEVVVHKRECEVWKADLGGQCCDPVIEESRPPGTLKQWTDVGTGLEKDWLIIWFKFFRKSKMMEKVKKTDWLLEFKRQYPSIIYPSKSSSSEMREDSQEVKSVHRRNWQIRRDYLKSGQEGMYLSPGRRVSPCLRNISKQR